MGSIVRHKDGYRAHVCVNGVRDSAIRRTRREAVAWMEGREEELAEPAKPITLTKAAEDWFALHIPTLDNEDNQRTVENSIRAHVLPFKPPIEPGSKTAGQVMLGDKSLAEIPRTDLVACVKALADAGKVETAQRVGQRICKIFDLAADSGLIQHGHPAANLARVLPRKRKRRHFPCVPPAEVPQLLYDIDNYSEPVTRLGLWLMAYTFTRTEELIGATYSEIRDPVTWVIPGDRMKRRLPHVVPLSRQVLSILDDLKAMRAMPENDYFLPSDVNPLLGLSNNTLLYALYRLGYKGRMCGHGFRTVASTILNESKLWDDDAIERQLAHKETDEVKEVYDKAEFLSDRRNMMQWWADHIDGLLANYRASLTANTSS